MFRMVNQTRKNEKNGQVANVNDNRLPNSNFKFQSTKPRKQITIADSNRTFKERNMIGRFSHSNLFNKNIK